MTVKSRLPLFLAVCAGLFGCHDSYGCNWGCEDECVVVRADNPFEADHEECHQVCDNDLWSVDGGYGYGGEGAYGYGGYGYGGYELGGYGGGTGGQVEVGGAGGSFTGGGGPGGGGTGVGGMGTGGAAGGGGQ